MSVFDPKELQKLKKGSELPENGEITIIGGSDLFHGAPILSLRAASRVVDMVYFSSPEPSMSEVAVQLKSQLSSFIWVPWEEVSDYVKKSQAILIGPGMKRYRSEKGTSEQVNKSNGSMTFDEAGTQTKFVVEKFLRQFPEKEWVIDGGALQVLDESRIPIGSILTPNIKEFNLLFNIKNQNENSKNAYQNVKMAEQVLEKAKEHNCTIVYKGPTTLVCSPDECVEIHGGNNGLTKGGTGDTLAGLTVALAARNDPVLAAAAASWAVKRAADELYQKVGTVYNADDLANRVSEVLGKYLR